jgi:small subunit ribosomal protein S4
MENVCKKCRREGVKLFLKGERCLSPKCALVHRGYAPGEHGIRPTRLSDFGAQLREKQKTRRIYGISERQFRNYFKKADRGKGVTGEILFKFLESRLDNVVYRLGFCTSRRQARSLVNHGHFLVNGKKVDISSYQVKEGDKIEVKKQSKSKALFKDLPLRLSQSKYISPAWLKLDKKNLSGQVLKIPDRTEIDTNIDESLIVEFYSR